MHPPGGEVGLGTYFRERVERFRGRDDVGSRRERMKKLDGRIKEVSRLFLSCYLLVLS